MKTPILVITSFLGAFTCASVWGAEILMQPVRASGPHTIAGTEIRLSPGGQRVFLEVKIKSFAPNALETYQAQLNSAGYSSGTSGVLGVAAQSCPGANSAGNSFCQTTFGDAGFGGSTCQDIDPGPNALFQCDWAWMNLSRTDWIAYGLAISIGSVVITTPNYRWGMTLGGGELVTDYGIVFYGGSLVLDVPADAVGTFTIGFITGPGITFLADQNNDEIAPLVLTPARITILCSNDAQCDDHDECTVDHCDAQTQECSNDLIDALRCDDGNACTQDECTPTGCMHSHYEGCSDIPAVSEWGLAVLALCLLIGAKLKVGLES